jgi:hypothetical protein
MTKPSLFIGSSTEGLNIARAVEYQLQHDVETTIWNEGFFQLGSATLETLVNSLERFDFAILILTPDDFIVSQDVPSRSPRDNVMFELGLFMGYLGRSRTFILYDHEAQIKLPSDLAGVTAAVFDSSRREPNLIASVSPACTLLRETIKKLGAFDNQGVQRLKKATDQVEAVSDTVERLVHLLARSRVVELDVTARMFGNRLPTDALQKIQEDLEELKESTCRDRK